MESRIRQYYNRLHWIEVADETLRYARSLWQERGNAVLGYLQFLHWKGVQPAMIRICRCSLFKTISSALHAKPCHDKMRRFQVMVCQGASFTRFRALKHESGISGHSTMIVRVIACFQPVQTCQAEYFRQLLKPVT
ncbi:hypothetical protein KP509_16G076800 [Ceratopteris richardii]|uniref:Uncharacterized protein n=1 Tax=Ceratopteris richardii TaxID=49495 RepID=A0A8T2T045_CERRI|nr:hypothetical protein KP509_16G076800 [Ceratopteris richardii]